MPSLKALAYDCRHATRLIEKKQYEGISLRHNLQLKYHLSGCASCRLYHQQSLLISRVMKDMVNGAGVKAAGLTDADKETMQASIETQMRKG
ncbi:MAG: hypothetical protein EOO09_17340 [Chitinophagaceae bacterium]|nr:MAG: hypothetical protein EOO09_17340 [Chitinophagaceae bacterium]